MVLPNSADSRCQRGDVERDPRELHVGEHLGERHLEVAVETVHVVRAQARVELAAQRERRTRCTCGRSGAGVGLPRLPEQLLGEGRRCHDRRARG